ncbi:hypothetical protein FOMPIDRAFT_1043901 [Fomitopsis schrenkii]|uniref:F-box domain-containing protein n=1 Tax=Fomitopsis schrenkii TaxID=2126942 RepID=S8DM06_FOMSC|nr:hypothetical protein FOMPIDRAFT_1043901 [Fomitopsis schrenkii]
MIRGKPLKLPLEVLLLILHATDSKSTLLAWCCLCHSLHDEAEQRLYRDLAASRSSHILKLSRALEKAPRRAAFVRSLCVRDWHNGNINSAIPTLNDMLHKLSNLAHLVLDMSASYQNFALYHTVLAAVQTCNFALESFEPRCVNNDPTLLLVLALQPNITSLRAFVASEDPPPALLPQDTLPRLKYLDTDYYFFQAVIRAPRLITHLSISGLPGMENGLQAVLRVVGHQLVSLKYEMAFRGNGGGPVNPPTIAFKFATLPRLRFLEVWDIMEEGFQSIFVPEGDAFAHVARPNIVLETLVWRLVWCKNGMSSTKRAKRVDYVREVAKPLLEACPSLRQMFYTESSSMIGNVGGMRIAQSANGGLHVQYMAEAELPNWKEV